MFLLDSSFTNHGALGILENNMIRYHHHCKFDSDIHFDNIGSLDDYDENSLIFLHALGGIDELEKRVKTLLSKDVAPAILITSFDLFNLKDLDEKISKSIITVKNPRLAYSIIASKLFPHRAHNAEISNHAIVAKDSLIGSGVSVGPFTTIGGDGLSPNRHGDMLHNTTHLGIIYICDNTSIGARCNIVNGVLTNTIIGESCSIANDVSIGHGTKISDRVMIAPHVVISGSCSIGDDTWIGPNVSIKEGITIGAKCFIGIGAVITKDIPDNSRAYSKSELVIDDKAKPW